MDLPHPRAAEKVDDYKMEIDILINTTVLCNYSRVRVFLSMSLRVHKNKTPSCGEGVYAVSLYSMCVFLARLRLQLHQNS